MTSRNRDGDHSLGMDRPITRRQFINGVSVAVTGSLLSSPWLKAYGVPGSPFQFAPEKDPGYYPPALTGLRGSQEGAWEIGHAMRDGETWDAIGQEADTGESYDLVVVGGGISGLAAAYFCRKAAGPQARTLVLDNHDDFGGHARRNEFKHGNRLVIGCGGTVYIDTPSSYSPESIGLIRELGIDVNRVYQYFDDDFYSSLNLGRGVFFDKETFGVDRLVVRGDSTLAEFAAQTPLNPTAQKDLVRLSEGKKDYMPGLTSDEKKERLTKISYRDYIRNYVKVDPQVITYLQNRTHSLFGAGIEAAPALDCWGLGYPGFQGLNLEKGPYPGMSLTTVPRGTPGEPYVFHFPDGCGSISRLLVRALIPESAPGNTMEDIVTARLNYARLDEDGQPVRIRLNSTVVRALHRGDPQSAKEVEVTYIRGGKAQRVRAKTCILACWNSVIPHLCPEMPEKQKTALVYGVKVPLVYTNVMIRNWTSFQKLGVSSVSCPGGFHTGFSLDIPVSMGDYQFARTPEDPMVLSMIRTPCSPGLPLREQYRAGREELLVMEFETFEREIRDQLGRALSTGGFDPARDIEGITVNRWPHGYAYEYNSLWDPIWPEEKQPCVIGRKPFGRISIANSDAAAFAYVNPAIDQAYRAVQEVLKKA